MTVTFSIESLPTGAFFIACYDEGTGSDVEIARADSHEAILVERAAHMLVCEECAHYGCFTQSVRDVSDELDVNLANTNAAMILSALGLYEDSDEGGLVGTVDADVFLGAIMLAMASDRDDTGVAPANLYEGQPGATMIDCGLRPGYYAETFGNLHTLATEAVRLGRSVTFS